MGQHFERANWLLCVHVDDRVFVERRLEIVVLRIAVILNVPTAASTGGAKVKVLGNSC